MARTYDTVVSEVANRLRLDTGQGNILALAQGWVNDVIQDVHGRCDWFWTLDRQVVQTVIDKTDGTVSVSVSGTTVTGVSTVFASADVGKFIQLGSTEDDWYKITAVASVLSLTIEKGYVGTTALSGAAYTIRQVFYSLPSAEKILTMKQAESPRKLACMHYRDFDHAVPFTDTTGPTTDYCLYGLDSDGNLQFSIYPHTDVARNLEVRYKKVATESDLTLIPAKWRGVYINGALVKGLEYVALGQPEFDKNLIIMKRQEYEAGIAAMLADSEPEADYCPRLQSSEAALTLPVPHLPETLSIPQD